MTDKQFQEKKLFYMHTVQKDEDKTWQIRQS